MGNDYSAALEAAKGYLKSNPKALRFGTAKLRYLLSKDAAVIRKMHEKATESTDKAYGDTEDCFAWLRDNYYVLEKAFYETMHSLKSFKSLACTQQRIPATFGAMCVYFDTLGCAPDKEAFEAFVSFACKAPELSPYFCDIYSYEYLAKAAILCNTAKACREFSRSGYKDIDKAKKLSVSTMHAVKALKGASVFDTEDLFCYLESERILCSDPVGAYTNMNAESKHFYRMRLSEIALKKGVSEEFEAREIIVKCNSADTQREKHVGYYLAEKKQGKAAYFTCLIGLSVLFTLILSVKISPVCVLLLFPIWETIKYLCDRAVLMFVKPQPVFSMEIDEVPEKFGVMTVITTLLTGEKADKEIFDRLERMYYSNGGKNVYFGVLADLCDSESQTNASDDAILSYALERIKDLNQKHGGSFYFFSRKRVYSKTQKCFIAPERKRGAVVALDKLLCGKGNDFDEHSVLPERAVCENISYCVTLDADTNLPIDGVLKMVSAMLHPLNVPVIDKKYGVVTQGYGIMQPAVSVSLKGAGENMFTRVMCGGGGRECYSVVSSDVYQTLFGFSGFCGKGIFDKNAFFAATLGKNAFRENYVLSHDAPEGARLRCAYLSNTELTDGFPKNELSYFKREHRWIRGDFQNLPFLLASVKNADGEKIQNRICGVSKYRMFDSVRRETTPVFSLICLVAGVFCGEYTAEILSLFAVSYVLIPFVSDLFFTVIKIGKRSQSAARKFYSPGIVPGLWQSLLHGVNELSMLAKAALVSIDAAVRSLYRMCLSHKNMLEWTTAAQSDASSKDGILGYVFKNLFSSALGVFVFVFSPSGIAKLVGLLWFFMPAVMYFSASADCGKNSGASEKSKQSLRRYAKDIWSFFEYTVTERDNFLPIDNLQLFPEERLAHRTSPTNIGLYLVCALCARDFGFIDSDELYLRLERTLDSIDRMEKYKGHLYNWYDTENLNVLEPRYVSSVDSGNFLACLLCVKQGIEKYSDECQKLNEPAQRVCDVFESTDFECIYDKKRNLFTLGLSFDGGKEIFGENCYDLLMSEARTLSFIAVSHRRVPAKHWQKLSRMPIRYKDRMGLASWSGTAFEYFMPALFMPSPCSSLVYEALEFAYRAQKARGAYIGNRRVWGISESGYFSFDYEMNYQYKAFGVPLLSLARQKQNELVISPYSSFLFTEIALKQPLDNLERLKKGGMYGKFGFYEARDFTPDRTPDDGIAVKSYMAHHLGMSLCACANAYFDGILKKRFMSEPANACAYELLEEKIPVDAYVKRVKDVYERPAALERERVVKSRIISEHDPENPVCCCISDGKCFIYASDIGYLGIKKTDISVNDVSDDRYGLTKSLFCFAMADGRALGSAQNPLSYPDVKYTFEYNASCLTQRAVMTDKKGRKYTFCSDYTIDKGISEVVRIRMSLSEVSSEDKEDFSQFALYFEPVLAPNRAHSAHPAFSGLFVEAQKDEQSGVLLFHRRVRNREEKEYYLAVACADIDAQFDFCISKDEIFNPPVTNDSFEKIFDFTPDNRTGACIIPACFLRLVARKKGGESRGEILLSISESRQKAISAVEECRNKSFEKSCEELSEIALDFYAAAKYSPVLCEGRSEEEVLLSSFIYPEKYKSENLSVFGMDALWRHGISGDFPIVCLYADSTLTKDGIIRLLKAYALIKYKGVRADVALVYNEREKYLASERKTVENIISECNAKVFVSAKDGGIFKVNLSELDDGGEKLFAASCFIYPKQQYEKKRAFEFDAKEIVTSPCGFSDKGATQFETGDANDVFFETAVGYFCRDFSFVADKKKAIRNPMSHVLSGRSLSTVVTHNSLGYTFSRNAAERRITAFYNDSMGLSSGEHIYIETNEKLYDLAACAIHVRYGAGYAKYTGVAGGFPFELCVFIPEKLPIKLYSLECSSEVGIIFTVKPIMGRFEGSNNRCNFSVGGGSIRFSNSFGDFFSETGFVFANAFDGSGVTSDARLEIISSGRFRGCAAGFFDAEKNTEYSKKRFVFSLGCAKNEETLNLCTSSVRTGIDSLYKSALDFSSTYTGKIRLSDFETCDRAKSLMLMTSFWLPYQNAICRFFARSGFFQSGGAYGFRDQLQDALCLMYFCPELTRSHIIRCAAHQFEEGDVLHWWHPCSQRLGKSHMGVRTRISDDYLWLAYAVSVFTEFTGDLSLLDVRIRYIKAPLLESHEHEKYISPEYSEIKESVYRHCLKALYRAYKLRGENGLCLIGTGDWSDGLNRLGKDGRGESVWLTMFLAMCMERFSKTAKEYGDNVTAEVLCERAKELYAVCDKNGYDEDCGYFARAYSDSKEKIGVKGCDECEIDLLPQSFAALSGAFDEKKTINSILNAYKMLYDEQNRIFRLLYPPFDNCKTDVGYIKGYVPGTRENGGQYTHAAVWGSMALFSVSERFKEDKEIHSKLMEMAQNSFFGLLPPLRMSDSELSEKYRAEPYVLCGDVYANKDFPARAGWSWYTGAAGWLFREILEYFFCVRFFNVQGESPCAEILPGAFEVPFCVSDGFSLDLTLSENLKVCIEYGVSDTDILSCDEKRLEINPKGTNVKLCGKDVRISVTAGRRKK